MTVKHLQSVQRSQIGMAVQTDPTVLHKFKAGFSDCSDEVSRYISQMDGVETGVKQRLIGHLNNCNGGLQQISPFNYGYRSTTGPFGSTPVPQMQQHVMPLPQDSNNNGRIQMNGVQLIPSRLPTGELALVMPNSSNLPYFPPATFPTQSNLDLNSNFPSHQLSAFNSVSKSQTSHLNTNSPPLSPVSSLGSSEDDSMPPSEYNSMSTTPPLQTQQNMMNLFPTPPSGGSVNKLSLKPITVQQPQITSTTESMLSIKPLSVITNTSTPRSSDQMSKKRPYNSDHSDGLLRVATEPAQKMFKPESPVHAEDQANDEQDMWRPW